MNQSLELSTIEIRTRRKKNLINKWFLGTFLFLGLFAFFLKIIDGALLDFGIGIDKSLADAGTKMDHIHTFHPGFWSYQKIIDIVNDHSSYDLSSHKPLHKFASIISMYRHHPSSIWLLTQFTWITTIIIVLFLLFRFFKYEDALPRWLKWIMTQRTLSLVTIYDSIVGIVFWLGMYKDFDNAFNEHLKGMEILVTILVHAIIPLFMVGYATVFVVKDKKASILKEAFIIKGMIYPTIYFLYYLLLTGVWSDPYNITQMHDSLIKINGGTQTLSGHSWKSELWKIVVAVIGIWVLMGIMILIHNITLLKLNKLYNPKKDYEIGARRERKIEKIKSSVTRKCAKNSEMEFEIIEEKMMNQKNKTLKDILKKRKK